MAKQKMEKRVEKLLREDPEAFVKAVLEHPFWDPTIKVNTGYQRYGDDTCGSIIVGFSSDSDGRIEVDSLMDPEEFDPCHRFRTYFGGGESLRTRQALMILARAILLDNEERSQEHRARRYAERLEEFDKIRKVERRT